MYPYLLVLFICCPVGIIHFSACYLYSSQTDLRHEPKQESHLVSYEYFQFTDFSSKCLGFIDIFDEFIFREFKAFLNLLCKDVVTLPVSLGYWLSKALPKPDGNAS